MFIKSVYTLAALTILIFIIGVTAYAQQRFTVAPGAVSVIVTSSVPVGGYQLTISFDPTLLELDKTKVTGGTGAGFTRGPHGLAIDSRLGIVTINSFQVGNSPRGAFPATVLPFAGLKAGTSTLRITQSTIVDTNGNEIPATTARITLSSDNVRVTARP